MDFNIIEVGPTNNLPELFADQYRHLRRQFRKITREAAALHGFPEGYELSIKQTRTGNDWHSIVHVGGRNIIRWNSHKLVKTDEYKYSFTQEYYIYPLPNEDTYGK